MQTDTMGLQRDGACCSRSMPDEPDMEPPPRHWVTYDFDSDEYDMNGDKHMFTFSLQNTPRLPCSSKRATAYDEAKLQQTFENVGYTVHTPYKDLTKQQVFKKLDEICKMEHRYTSSVAVVFLAHGNSTGRVHATDTSFLLKDVNNHMLHAPSLAGKPKLFFNQVCRNYNQDSGHQVFNNSRVAYTIPTHSDYLAMSSFEDRASLCSRRGSLFLETLCDVVSIHHQQYDVVDMTTLVNNRLDMHLLSPCGSQRSERKPTMKLQYTLTKFLKL